jgi:hypothetical protein
MRHAGWILSSVLVLLSCAKAPEPSPPQPATDPAQAGTHGLMNFRQIRGAWSVAIGVEAFAPSINDTFNALQSRLPASNAADQLTQPAVTAAVAVGASFCSALVNREATLAPKARRGRRRQARFGDLETRRHTRGKSGARRHGTRRLPLERQKAASGRARGK